MLVKTYRSYHSYFNFSFVEIMALHVFVLLTIRARSKIARKIIVRILATLCLKSLMEQQV